MPIGAGVQLQVRWGKCAEDEWCPLNMVDLKHQAFAQGGVYMAEMSRRSCASAKARHSGIVSLPIELTKTSRNTLTKGYS